MSRASALTKKLDKLLTKFAPPERKVYKRVVTRTGGDDLIGRPSSVTNADTLLSPQPIYSRAGRTQVGGDEAIPVVAGTKRRMAEDYTLTVSPNALALSDLENPDLLIVLKDAAGVEEVYRVTDYESVGLEGTDVVYLVNIRSTKR